MITPPEPLDEQALEQLEIDLLLTALEQRYGYDFRDYSRASLTRRLRQARSNEGLRSFARLQHELLRDPAVMQRLVRCLSIHVTSMFRDPAFYVAFRRYVIPLLRTYPFVRIWHAGCSTGEEVYSLAIVLHEAGLFDRSRIYATDLSDALLKRARRGIFSLETLTHYELLYRQAGGQGDFFSYFTTDNENAILRDRIRRRILFSHHNLVSDGSFNEFHVILCRNVMIYFNPTLRDRVLGLLYESLIRFGILGLGMKESVTFTPFADAYEEVAPNVRLYRRIG